MSYCDKMTEDFKVLTNDDVRVTNGYKAEGNCPNCGNDERILVKRGILLSAVHITLSSLRSRQFENHAMKEYKKGDKVIVHAVVISYFTEKLGCVMLEAGDIQGRVMAIPRKNIELEEKPLVKSD